MKIKILKPKAFVSLRVGTNPKEVAEIADLELHQLDYNLVVTHEGTKLLKFPSSALALQFNEKDAFISEQKHSKHPLALVLDVNKEELTKMIDLQNKRSRCRSPLAVEFETEVRESLITARFGENTNYRGIINLLIVFSVLNYWRFFAEHVKNHGLLVRTYFLQFFAGMLLPQTIIFLMLYVAYFFFVFYLQKYAFKANQNELMISGVFTSATLVFLVISSKLCLALDAPFMLNSTLNVFTIGSALKMISFSHVLYNVRWIIKNLKKPTSEAEKNEFLSSYVLPHVFSSESEDHRTT